MCHGYSRREHPPSGGDSALTCPLFPGLVVTLDEIFE
jgi:hypothetical protein